ncbi:unnamed protein product, partial [Mesorhabditis spiculigera]
MTFASITTSANNIGDYVIMETSDGEFLEITASSALAIQSNLLQDITELYASDPTPIRVPDVDKKALLLLVKLCETEASRQDRQIARDVKKIKRLSSADLIQLWHAADFLGLQQPFNRIDSELKDRQRLAENRAKPDPEHRRAEDCKFCFKAF